LDASAGKEIKEPRRHPFVGCVFWSDEEPPHVLDDVFFLELRTHGEEKNLFGEQYKDVWVKKKEKSERAEVGDFILLRSYNMRQVLCSPLMAMCSHTFGFTGDSILLN
jgi:hypothetical protein